LPPAANFFSKIKISSPDKHFMGSLLEQLYVLTFLAPNILATELPDLFYV